jgi:predicted NUDIX family NTP pyrophosphohydrolase
MDMAQNSAGIIMYRYQNNMLQVFLVHPGGPFWVNKDFGAWSIPKGLIDQNEDAFEAAKREFEEETGFTIRDHAIKLSPVKLKGGKVVQAWAVEGNCDPSALKSNTFVIEWPAGSGRQREFPEVDRAAWFDVKGAQKKINQGQIPFIEELHLLLSKESEGRNSQEQP